MESAAETIFAEYHGEGVHAPCFMAVRERFKYIRVPDHEERLYDLEHDPDEFVNLAGRPAVADVMDDLRETVLRRFDPVAIARDARRSQRNRRFVLDAYAARRA